jgi:hypothetical protein
MAITAQKEVFQEVQTGVAPLPPLKKKARVRKIETAADLEKVLRFRYEIYYKQMGRDKAYADHDRQILMDPLDSVGVHFAAFDPLTDDVVGIIRINFWEDQELPEDELYHYSDFVPHCEGRVSLTSKMIIDPLYRGSTLFLDLIRGVYEEAVRRGNRYNFIATNDHLVPLFQRIGYVAHQPRTTWGDYGSSNPLVVDLWDAEHLTSVNSPLVRWGIQMNKLAAMPLAS